MVQILHGLSLVLVVLALVPVLAHALELPGKLRLSKDAYAAVQTIYYPGFTFAGISEPVAIIATMILLVLTPRGTADFWLTLVGLLGLVGMHAVYWLRTHPVNNFWLRNETLSGLGSGFFAVGAKPTPGGEGDWTALRDRWEYSHVVRAGLAGLSFVALLVVVI